jgi:hypothetical protein
MASDNRAYHRTAFIPALHGQYKLFRGPVTTVCNQADVIVVLGNLISCTPHIKDREGAGPNEAILKQVDILASKNGALVQLVGANEIAALNAPQEWTNATSRQLLREAWLGENPTLQVAAVSKGRLITSAGLTYGEWVAIGRPQTAVAAAEALNERYSGTLHQGQCFRLGGAPNYSANPIWADTFMELYASWITAPEDAPFDQLHGGENLNSEVGRLAVAEKFSVVHYTDDIRFRNFGSVVTVRSMEFRAIGLELPQELLSTLPKHQAIYLEKTAL